MKWFAAFVWASTLCLASSQGSADEPNDWTSWRGPDNTGAVPGNGYPTDLEPSKARWKTELPGKGCSTPIVLNRRIYITAPVNGHDALLCFDADGKELWQTTFGKEDAGKHRNGSGSNASPVTDGKSIFVYYKSGTLASVALDGGVLWQTNLVERFGKDTLFWDHGTSPVLTERYVIMARMHQGESWIAAFDKATGEMAWKVPRNYAVPTECDHGYSTPLVIPYQGEESILVWGAEHVTIHSARDGTVRWSCGGFNPEGATLWPGIVTPVIADGIVTIAYGRNDRGTPRLFGIRLDGTGDVTATNHVWQRNDVGTFVPTPAVVDGKIVLVRDHGEVECLEPSTGKNLWKGNFLKSRANFYASPLVAGAILYAPREDGVVFVASIQNGDFQVLGKHDFGEPVIGGPVPLGNEILIRGENHLYCFAR